MSDALASATASFEVLQRQLGDCATIVEALHKSMDAQSASLPLSTMMVGNVSLSYLVIFFFFCLLFDSLINFNLYLFQFIFGIQYWLFLL